MTGTPKNLLCTHSSASWQVYTSAGEELKRRFVPSNDARAGVASRENPWEPQIRYVPGAFAIADGTSAVLVESIVCRCAQLHHSCDLPLLHNASCVAVSGAIPLAMWCARRWAIYSFAHRASSRPTPSPRQHFTAHVRAPRSATFCAEHPPTSRKYSRQHHRHQPRG